MGIFFRNKFFILIFAVGIAYTLYQQTFIKDEVFFSGDGGLKALMAKQFLRGEFHPDLRLDTPSWVKNLWDNGLYPFDAPFVYKQHDRYYLSFDLLFPLLHAPFYKWFGFRGFHIVPMIATWIIWLLFYFYVKDDYLNDKWRAAALTILIFSSYLSLFSVTYWEHTLAIALAFGGVVLITKVKSSEDMILRYVISGFLIGFSVWFRPEFYCFVGAMTIVPFIFKYINWNSRQKIAFYSSMYSTVLVFMIANYYLYGHPLSVHSYQIIGGYTLVGQIKRYFKVFAEQSFFLLMYFPMFVFYVFSILIFFRDSSWKKRDEFIFFAAIIFLMLVATPLIIPNRGVKLTGPRFVMITLPFISYHSVFALKSLIDGKHKYMKLSLVLFAACFLAGIQRDACIGTDNLRKDFRDRISPTLNYLRYDTRKIVVADHQYIPQELESAFDFKIFFKAKDISDFKKLVPALKRRGYFEFIYIAFCLTDKTKNMRRLEKRETVYSMNSDVVIFKKIGIMGDYYLYEGYIVR